MWDVGRAGELLEKREGCLGGFGLVRGNSGVSWQERTGANLYEIENIADL